MIWVEDIEYLHYGTSTICWDIQYIGSMIRREMRCNAWWWCHTCTIEHALAPSHDCTALVSSIVLVFVCYMHQSWHYCRSWLIEGLCCMTERNWVSAISCICLTLLFQQCNKRCSITSYLKEILCISRYTTLAYYHYYILQFCFRCFSFVHRCHISYRIANINFYSVYCTKSSN